MNLIAVDNIDLNINEMFVNENMEDKLLSKLKMKFGSFKIELNIKKNRNYINEKAYRYQRKKEIKRLIDEHNYKCMIHYNNYMY